jgi:prepilin-type N-terminal cleavage/methylation domain-containing protein
MRTRKYKYGMSLIEILIVVGVIALLVTMVVGVASRIDNQTKEKGVESIFALLDSALQEYHEFTSHFPEQPEKNYANAAIHSELLYKELYSIPASQKILEKIDSSFVENKYGTAQTPPEIYDPWGTALDYRYVAGDNFPHLTSAGPDKIFGTTDDMSNK